MKATFLHLIIVALIATAIATTIASAGQDIVCEWGSYGKVMAQQQGRC